MEHAGSRSLGDQERRLAQTKHVRCQKQNIFLAGGVQMIGKEVQPVSLCVCHGLQKLKKAPSPLNPECITNRLAKRDAPKVDPAATVSPE